MSKKELDASRITASGNGIDQGITGQECVFYIHGVAKHADNVTTTIDGPAQPSMAHTIDENGNVVVKYTPNLPGEYTLGVQFNGKPIKGSPFTVSILGDSDPKYQRITKVQVAGKGTIIGKANMQSEFWIDGRAASLSAGLYVHIKNPERASSQLKINDMGDGTFKCTYKPTAPGQYVINVKVEGIHVPGSPFYARIT